VLTRVDPQHFAHAPHSAVAASSAGLSHSAAVTAGSALYTWRQGEAGSQVPGGLADLANKLVPTPVPRQLLGGACVDRCHGLLEELALASPWGRTGGLGSGAGARGGGEDQGCLYSEMPAELVKKVVERCGWKS
jgi:hypothetical protein